MPIQLIPIFPEEATTAPAAEKPDAVRQHEHDVQMAYLGGLAQDEEFLKHLLNGWLKNEETTALRDLSTVDDAELVRARQHWLTLKQLRTDLADKLTDAKRHAAGLSAQQQTAS